MEIKYRRTKKAHCIFKQGITDQEAIILNIYALNIGALNFIEQILPIFCCCCYDKTVTKTGWRGKCLFGLQVLAYHPRKPGQEPGDRN